MLKVGPPELSRFAEALQPGTRTLLTEIDVPNSDGALAAWIYCTVELHILRKTPSLLVPAEAIIFKRDGLHVAVVEGGIARIRKVAVARDLGSAVEVRDGVKSGDQVILTRQSTLSKAARCAHPARAQVRPIEQTRGLVAGDGRSKRSRRLWPSRSRCENAAGPF
jgi:hypothetical protein